MSSFFLFFSCCALYVNTCNSTPLELGKYGILKFFSRSFSEDEVFFYRFWFNDGKRQTVIWIRVTKMITGDWANNLKMLDLEYKLKKITIYGCLAFGWRFCNWQQSATCWWLLVVMLDWAGSQRRLSPTTRVGIKNPPKKTHPKKPKKTHLKKPTKSGFFGFF